MKKYYIRKPFKYHVNYLTLISKREIRAFRLLMSINQLQAKIEGKKQTKLNVGLVNCFKWFRDNNNNNKIFI